MHSALCYIKVCQQKCNSNLHLAVDSQLSELCRLHIGPDEVKQLRDAIANYYYFEFNFGASFDIFQPDFRGDLMIYLEFVLFSKKKNIIYQIYIILVFKLRGR